MFAESFEKTSSSALAKFTAKGLGGTPKSLSKKFSSRLDRDWFQNAKGKFLPSTPGFAGVRAGQKKTIAAPFKQPSVGLKGSIASRPETRVRLNFQKKRISELANLQKRFPK